MFLASETLRSSHKQLRGAAPIALGQEFPQRRPIVRIPSRIKMIEVTFRKTGVVKNDPGLRIDHFEFKLHQRINSLGKLLR